MVRNRVEGPHGHAVAEIGQEGGILFDLVADGGSRARTERLEPGNRCGGGPAPSPPSSQLRDKHVGPLLDPDPGRCEGEKVAPTFMAFGYCLVT